jgi:hypothetical protein
MEHVSAGYDRRPLLVLVTSNLDNLVYFAASAVALGRRSSPLAEGGRHTFEAERAPTKVIVVIEVNGYCHGNLHRKSLVRDISVISPALAVLIYRTPVKGQVFKYQNEGCYSDEPLK